MTKNIITKILATTMVVSSLVNPMCVNATSVNGEWVNSNGGWWYSYADGTIAKDVDGNDCVGLTDENGMVDFTLMYEEDNTYYVQETKAPNGYNINTDKFEVKPTDEKDTLGTDLIKITILDTSIVIPPKTNDMIPIMLVVIIALIGVCGIIVFRKQRKIN